MKLEEADKMHPHLPNAEIRAAAERMIAKAEADHFYHRSRYVIYAASKFMGDGLGAYALDKMRMHQLLMSDADRDIRLAQAVLDREVK